MIRNFPNEKWKKIVFDNKISEKENYKISNYGRVINYNFTEPFLKKETYINGYAGLSLKLKSTGKHTKRYVHKLVAQHFLSQKEDEIYVIHLDYDKTNNNVNNLKWATKKEKEVHQFSNPTYKNTRRKPTFQKLTETKVKLIKRKLNDPNRRTRLKMIAKQFGISEMQLYRIKIGENWGYVTEY